jgi:hypothetical protein
MIQPLLSLNDIGIELDKDSDDLSTKEIESALDTEDLNDFVSKVKEIVSLDTDSQVSSSLRRKEGTYYCKIINGTEKTLLRMNWLKSPKLGESK